jgi:ABC-type iron transport system FetAB ATPase subunit
MARIELNHVTKRYPGGVPAVNDVTLDIPDGEFMVLVGPSGSGKSTALRMVAGLEGLTSGEVWIGNRVVNDLPPRDRDIAMVFQNYALYPHMTVEENLAFGLQLHKTPKPEQARRVAEAARILGLEPYLKRKPAAVRTPPVEHEVMVAQLDTAARDASEDQDQAGGLAGEGESLWTARVNPKSSVRPGRPVDLAVDTSALYWFDPHSGHAIPRQPGDQPSGAEDTTPPQAAA